LSAQLDAPPLSAFVASSAEAILNACTACGRCVEVCPVVPFAGLTGANPKEVVSGVLGALAGNATRLTGDAATWAHQCNGCGACIPACPEGVNPRQMIMLANTRDARHGTPTPQLFRKMARAIRLMAAMQLMPDDLRRLLQPPRARDAEVVFYLGCNAIRTPHILFNAMYVLDALEVDYEVLGGPSACCGIIHSKWEGDLKTGGQVTTATLHRFGEFKPKKVLNWCPSCELHLGETIKGYQEASFDFDHITKYLVEREAELKARMTTPVNLRVLLHTHTGMAGLGENVARLLRAIPGLTLVDTLAEAGYTCGGSGADRSPALKEHLRAETLRRVTESVAESDCDALVSLYHGCHQQLAVAGREHGFQVLNFTDLLVRALGGTPREDALEAYRALGEWHAIAEAAEPRLKASGIEFDPGALAAVLPEVFASAEFRGGLQAFAGAEPQA
jgi:heterodisulfide reductase subunit D